MSDKTNDVKKKTRTVQEIMHNLIEVFEMYPQYSIAQHLWCIQRRKSVDAKKFFFWSDEEVLKSIEKHKEELSGEELMSITSED